MALAYLIKIDSTDITKLTEYQVGRNKLWTAAGRNMSGDLHSVGIGIFPKLELGFGYLNADEASLIAGLLDNFSFEVEWWDLATQTYKTADYYAADFKIPILDIIRELYKPFKVNLIPYKKLA